MANTPNTETDPGKTPLVNEKTEPPTYDQLQKQLADSREEVRRNEGNLKTLRESNSALQKKLEARPAVSTATASATPTGATLTAPAEYIGPSQSEIYLALVSGAFGSINPLKQLDPKSTLDLAKSVVGLSEIFFSEAIKRKSFLGSGNAA